MNFLLLFINNLFELGLVCFLKWRKLRDFLFISCSFKFRVLRLFCFYCFFTSASLLTLVRLIIKYVFVSCALIAVRKLNQLSLLSRHLRSWRIFSFKQIWIFLDLVCSWLGIFGLIGLSPVWWLSPVWVADHPYISVQ